MRKDQEIQSDLGRESADSGNSLEEVYGFNSHTSAKGTPVPEGLALDGVDHSARPTWKLRETVEFYRDTLGLPLVHTISARGWGPPGHHDFLHFFFDSGLGSTIAFFYYIGSEQPARYVPESHHFYLATHTAWRVETNEELTQWKNRLEGLGVSVSPYTRHEILESIYFQDPNGYPIEITRRLRDITQLDADDAALTLDAAMDLEDQAKSRPEVFDCIDQVWRAKGKLVANKINSEKAHG